MHSKTVKIPYKYNIQTDIHAIIRVSMHRSMYFTIQEIKSSVRLKALNEFIKIYVLLSCLLIILWLSEEKHYCFKTSAITYIPLS